MAVFAKVVDEGTFRAAAKELGLAPSRVSQTVSDLEQYLGVSLMHRTTRKLVLTNEGRMFYAHVADLIRNAEAGLNELNALSLKPIGSLKISIPAFLASSSISTAIAEFSRQHSEVTLSLIYTDHVVDMLNEGVDLSIRAGWLEDSTMMSRKLGEGRRILVAGKEYADGHPPPKHPSDLRDWEWIRFRVWPNTIEFESTSGEIVNVPTNSRIQTDSAEALWHFACQNLGLTILPKHLAEEGLRSGKFVHLIPEWKLKPLGYYAVWPDKSRRENLTLLMARFLAERGLSSV